MSDPFLEDARANWRGLDAEVAQMANKLRRQQVASRLGFAAELAGAGIAVAAGVWLLFWGLEGAHAVLGAIAGLVLVIGVPLLTLASYLTRRGHPRWEAETPEGVLRYALRRLDVVTALLRVSRWHAYVLIGFVAALWGGAGLGWIAVDAFLAFFTVFYLGVAGGVLLWTRWRRGRVDQERAHCEAMLAEYL